jgi:DNA-binding PadR family transcriptional regulator
MPRPRDELTAGEWAVLALLAESPTHGFAIARAMAPDGEVGHVWSVRRPLVYRAIETLTRMGLVRPAGTVPSRSGPRRTVLEATPDGKRAVTRWLRQPVGHVRDARSLLMLKLLFPRAATPTSSRCSALSARTSRSSANNSAARPMRPRASIAHCCSGAWRARRPRPASSRRCSANRPGRAAPPSAEPCGRVSPAWGGCAA